MSCSLKVFFHDILRTSSVTIRDVAEELGAQVGQPEDVLGTGFFVLLPWLPRRASACDADVFPFLERSPLRVCVAHLCALSQRCLNKLGDPDLFFTEIYFVCSRRDQQKLFCYRYTRGVMFLREQY